MTGKDPLFDVTDKICIVTGGLGQLGAQYVKALHERDAKVAVWGRHMSRERAEKKFAELGFTLDENIRLYQVDISKKDDLNQALDDIEAVWGAPDVLVNNAGIDTQPSAPPEVSGPFENFPEEVFREVVEVNLVGTFLACQAVGARIKKAGKPGSIINIGSIYGMVSPIQDIYAYKKELTGVPFIKPVAYSAAKSGIYNLTRYLATYWGKDNIRVNTLTPAGVWRDTQDEIFQGNFCARMPMGRMSREDEYNGSLIFLASSASSFMTGANLVVDGGWTAW
ncbi:MAG: SDR family oxidoreductase [Lachnospiraceae bacterium]|uniref:SDR family oxidoreductase n=1 Tax=Parablautia sp. Marseille-Q6255 TaxID=3039593 RepID=UPI0024BC01B7|nr:SDR family oxidoreductase [Parablautia sp. Marseille-Q6255]